MVEVELQTLAGQEAALGPAHWSNGMLLTWIEPDREPTKHLVRELGELKREYETRGLAVVLVLGEDQLAHSFDPQSYTDLPQGTGFYLDRGYQAQRGKGVGWGSPQLPNRAGRRCAGECCLFIDRIPDRHRCAGLRTCQKGMKPHVFYRRKG